MGRGACTRNQERKEGAVPYANQKTRRDASKASRGGPSDTPFQLELFERVGGGGKDVRVREIAR